MKKLYVSLSTCIKKKIKRKRTKYHLKKRFIFLNYHSAFIRPERNSISVSTICKLCVNIL